MKIEWNKVTKFSQAVAIVLFLAVFSVGFLIGRRFENKLVLGEPITHVKFVCAENKVIVADFYDHMVYLESPLWKAMYLPQTISASGARYANEDESFIFWNKGNTAFMEQNGVITISNCVIK